MSPFTLRRKFGPPVERGASTRLAQRFFHPWPESRACRGVARLRIAKFSSNVTVEAAGRTLRLSRDEAAQLLEALTDAITEQRCFIHTIGERRADGSYRVARRRADSTGNATVFDSLEELRRLFDDLPREFTAADVEHPGVSGSRRHLVVRHLAEHPGFPCRLTDQQPLTAEKVH